jgi:ketosteroid isomerase-like protein
MKRAVWWAAGVCASLVGLGVVARGEMTPSIRAIVDQDRAFAAASVAKTTRDAFMDFLADDSLLFRPQPVPGKMFMRRTPSPPGKLVWAPAYADAASSDDLGVTVGPYESRKEMTDPATAWGHYVAVWRKQKDATWKVEVHLGISHEKFSTAVADVKEAETPPASAGGAKPASATGAPAAAGAGTVAVKAGDKPAAAGKAGPGSAGAAGAAAGAGAKATGAPAASGAAPATAKPGAATAGSGSTVAATAPANPPAAGAAAPAKPGAPSAATAGTANPPAAGATPTPAQPLSPQKQAEEALKELDRAFTKIVAEQGAVKAYAASASPHVRVYRNGSLPVIGKAAVEKMQPSALGASWQPAHARIAASGDFAYSTGMISMNAAPTPGSQGQPQYYLRVWRKDKSGVWKLELDIVN